MISSLIAGRALLISTAVTVLCLATLHQASSPTQAQTLTERQILEAFYDATDGTNWTNSTNWKTAADLGAWYGVTTDTDGRVTRLELRSKKLAGSLPSSLGQLSYLERLYLHDNELTGEIPSELGNLANLLTLGLSNNRLTGEIPSELGNLTSMTHLELAHNEITGPIPPELGNLESLLLLQLHNNQLTGSIPPELGRLSELIWLRLWDNELTGPIPSELGDVTNLQQLDIHHNRLTGAIPPELGNLADMVGLYLHNNRLTGTIPPELGRLTKMTHLIIWNNRLTGSIPPELGNLTSLVGLSLGGNELTGSIPPELGDIGTSLTHLVIGNSNLRGSIPSELSKLTSLQELTLSSNQLSGGIPSWLSSLTQLTRLHLHNNELTGEIPADLNSIAGLTILRIEDNALSGALPDLSGLTALTRLGLGGNEFDFSWSTFETGGELPLDSGTALTHLYLHDSGLEGSIPVWLASHIGLQYLYLHDNELTGELPDFDALTALTRLGLGGNDLDLSWSTFESDDHLNLSTRDNLLVLYLHESSLSGSIPSWLDNHTRMWRLHLHGNDLDGGWEALEAMTNLNELTMPRDAVSAPGLRVWLRARPNFLAFPDGSSPTASDAVMSRVAWRRVALDAEDVHVPPHPRIERVVDPIEESAVDIAVQHRGANGDALGGELSIPAVVCLPVPSTHADRELRLLRHDGSASKYLNLATTIESTRHHDGSGWMYLEPSDVPSGYDPGSGNVAVCGLTDSFSRFVAAEVEVVSGVSSAGGYGLISRIEPTIRSVTVSQGDELRLSFDVYGRQDILDNGLADGHMFIWNDDGAGGAFEAADHPNTIIYTAPTAHGGYTLTATSPDGACMAGEDFEERCSAKFTIIVRRSSAVLDQRPAPKNPVGVIPSVLVDAEGRQYEVLTPEEGGTFDGGGITLSADPGVVPNGEIVGVRIDVAGSASNIGETGQRYTLAGQWYHVIAVDADGALVSSYTLEAPLRVCLPLPPVLRSNIADIAMVASNTDDSLTILSGSVRIATSGTQVCAGLSTLPATVAVGHRGSPADLPTPTASPDEVETPDTGGTAPINGALLLPLIIGAAFILVGAALLRHRRSAKRIAFSR